MKITLELDGVTSTFTTIEQLSNHVSGEELKSVESKLIKAVKASTSTMEYLKSTGYKLPLGVIHVGSYKGMTEYSDDYYIEDAGVLPDDFYDNLDEEVFKATHPLFDTIDKEPSCYPTIFFHFVEFTEDFSSFRYVEDSTENY